MDGKLKKFFEENGISQQKVADTLGVSLPYVNAVLNGTKTLGKKNAEKWANLFGLSKTFLLTGEGSVIPDERQRKIADRANDIQMAVLGHPVKEHEAAKGIVAEDDPRPFIPSWADALLGILSKQIAENEFLHSELKQSISDIQEMKKQLAVLLGNIK